MELKIFVWFFSRSPFRSCSLSRSSLIAHSCSSSVCDVYETSIDFRYGRQFTHISYFLCRFCVNAENSVVISRPASHSTYFIFSKSPSPVRRVFVSAKNQIQSFTVSFILFFFRSFGEISRSAFWARPPCPLKNNNNNGRKEEEICSPRKIGRTWWSVFAPHRQMKKTHIQLSHNPTPSPVTLHLSCI